MPPLNILVAQALMSGVPGAKRPAWPPNPPPLELSDWAEPDDVLNSALNGLLKSTGVRPSGSDIYPFAFRSPANLEKKTDAAGNVVMDKHGRPVPVTNQVPLGAVVIDFGEAGGPLPSKPRYGAFLRPPGAPLSFTIQPEIGSLGKIGVLYAALQLRDDVRQAYADCRAEIQNDKALSDVDKQNKLQLLDIEAVKNRLTQLWSVDVARKNLSVPDLARLFAFSAEKKDIDIRHFDVVGFVETALDTPFPTPMSDHGIPDTLEDIHGDEHAYGLASDSDKPAKLHKWTADLLSGDAIPEVDPTLVGFAKRLWLMSCWSDNLAATLCQLDIGAGKLDFLQTVLKQSGLWGKLNHDDGGFLIEKIYQVPSRDLYPSNAYVPGPKGHWADAESLARLMIATWQKSLISAEASTKMLGLLRRLDGFVMTSEFTADRLAANRGAESFIIRGLVQANYEVHRAWTKIGISENFAADWAIFQLGITGTLRTFGLVAVNGSTGLPGDDGKVSDTIVDFAVQLAQKLGWANT
jgi:hypothetical protein